MRFLIRSKRSSWTNSVWTKVTMEARFREDLEADSLDLVELIMEFEEKFGGEISDEEAQKITTVGEAVNYLKAQLAKKGS